MGPSSPYLYVRDATFPFRREPIATIPTRGVYANRWELTEHIGTHLDAPCHFDEGARCVDALPLADLFAEAVVIDVSSRAEADVACLEWGTRLAVLNSQPSAVVAEEAPMPRWGWGEVGGRYLPNLGLLEAVPSPHPAFVPG
jgi:kynurenine formamidase